MREIFIFLFGREGEDIPEIFVDGDVWYQAARICVLLGCDTNSVIRDNAYFLALDDDEKLKLRVNRINRHSDVWFISETGFWKLLGLSKGYQAQRFRAWVTTVYLPAMFGAHVRLDGVAERGYRRLFEPMV